MPLRTLSLGDLTIDDEGSFAHVVLYAKLKRALERSSHRFHIPAAGSGLSWDRALFLNLTYWNAHDSADVLSEYHIPADVVAHVAWHHVVATRLAAAMPHPVPAAGMLLGECIASAFDLYLVGRLYENAPGSDFIATQVSIMSEAAQEAGLSAAGFATLLDGVQRDPGRAFEDMRALLFDAASALLACPDAVAAQVVLESFTGHRFEPLLHHYQLSNWVLYARAYASLGPESNEIIRQIDQSLRRAPVALHWLDENWL